jgi:secreted PhoX family phosphatase
VDYHNISFAHVNGSWIHCAASLSPWNTYLGSEEYEPDAKTREGLPKAAGSDDATDINSFSQYYFGDNATANPYHYGLLPEVQVRPNGTTTVAQHYALGRISRELADVQPDWRTVYMGDDGA